VPEEVKPSEAKKEMERIGRRPDWGSTDNPSFKNPLAQKDGKTYRAARISGLFILAKLDPKTPGTDNGWVYGTVSAGKVTSAGRVGYCMRCHESKPDRLYGLDHQAKKGGK
jgi:hypothetical protein